MFIDPQLIFEFYFQKNSFHINNFLIENVYETPSEVVILFSRWSAKR